MNNVYILTKFQEKNFLVDKNGIYVLDRNLSYYLLAFDINSQKLFDYELLK